MIEATDPQTEREAQSHWLLLPQYQGLRVFDQLLTNEFADPADIARNQDLKISRLLRFAAAQVPYYQAQFDSLNIVPSQESGMAVLSRLPVLGKLEFQENELAFRATALPAGEKVFGWTASSGTTGRPTRVLQTVGSNLMFTYLGQRMLRWCRWDPMGLRADIRAATQFPPDPNGQRPQIGSSFHAGRWRHLGKYFKTGESVGLCVTNPLARQCEWLESVRPNYLLAYPSTLERLAYELGTQAHDIGIQSALAISEQMTAVMRRRVEASFGLHVEQNYGLNEIGLVAHRCRAGRYHVNVEHCFVEVLDDQGQACKVGQIGRLVVTALRNPAMPLLRYDTGDLAEAVDGPCPCGRTLPAFASIVGRYRRMAQAPDGTSLQVYVLKAALESMPPELNANLRQYQIRQQRDGSYAVLLKIAAELPAAFEGWLHRQWQERIKEDRPALSFQIVDEIPLSASGKVEDFISEAAPPADEPPPGS